MENLSDYITHNYGSCQLVTDGKNCACLKHGWIGKDCYSWKPVEASSWEELREAQKNIAPVAQRLELGAHNA